MKLLSTIILSLLLFSCNNILQTHNKDKDELRQIDFKYLNEVETYNFLNSYYLPRLDTIETGRKIFIHPINKPDFSRWLKVDTTKIVILRPEPIIIDSTFNWDYNRLKNVNLITQRDDDMMKKIVDINQMEIWRKKIGHGYVCISRLAFNAYTKRIIIREWIENNSTCGTDRERILTYKLNINGKWQLN